jgi:putative spermidine/putrescine transport system substrate-binding protein
MSKASFLTTITAFSLAVLITPGFSQGRQLTVVGAGGALQDAERKAFFEPFAKVANVKVTEDSYSGQMAKVKAMVASKNVSWDVMQVEQNSIYAGCDEGLFEKFDWSKVGTKRDFLATAYSDCGVGAFVWSMVASYNKDTIKDGPRNWADFWDTKKWPGKRGFRQTAKMTLEIALLADGVEHTDIYKVLATKPGQDRAFAKLDQIKPSILWWTSGAESVERIVSGDVVMSATFNGRVSAVNAAGKNLALIWDGQVYGIDFWGIVKGSPNKAVAEEFIAFASKPEVQSEFPKHIAYGVTHKEANAKIDPKIASSLPTAPANLATAIGMDTVFWADYGEALEARFASWRAQ